MKLEGSHWQPKKLSGIIIVLISLFLTKLLQGNKDIKSIAKFELCGTPYWIVFAVFVVICTCLILLNAKIALSEY